MWLMRVTSKGGSCYKWPGDILSVCDRSNLYNRTGNTPVCAELTNNRSNVDLCLFRSNTQIIYCLHQ